MKFTCNTKPLTDALALGVVDANVSSFHKKSNIVQLSVVDEKHLKINIESANIKTEILVQGSADEVVDTKLFVSSTLLKKLVATLDKDVTTLEFGENELIIHSGKSVFNLPKMVDGADLQLDEPGVSTEEAVVIQADDWKFIKDNQMYAISMSFIYPVYTMVWISSEGDVLVGDYGTTLFTHSKHGKLGRTCLLSDTIINLFISLPEGSKLAQFNEDYIITYSCDSFIYRTQFTPQYESDENVGSYNADIFLAPMKPSEKFVAVAAASLNKILSQAELLNSNSDAAIELQVADGKLTLKDSNVDCQIAIDEAFDTPFSLFFKISDLRKIIASYGDQDIKIAPVVGEEGDVAAIFIWNSEMSTLKAGLEMVG